MQKIKYLVILVLAMTALNSCKDEEPVVIPEVGFKSASSVVMENVSQGTLVEINFSTEAQQSGTILVTLTPDANTSGSDFVTTPSSSNDVITLPFEAGATKVSFFVKPVDNADRNEDKTISFVISSDSEMIQLGETLEHIVTIKDDEPDMTILNIAELKSIYESNTDNDSTFTEDLYTGGIVISTNDNIQSKNVFIQDHTGGIVLRFQDNNTLTQGDSVLVNINGGRLYDFNGLIQISNLNLSLAESKGAGTLPSPVVITIEQLNSNDYQSTLVTIENVYFSNPDGSTIAGNTKFSDGSNESVLRVESYAPFKEIVIPTGKGTLSGIAGMYNSAQLIPIKETDIFESNGNTQIIFTGVDNGALADFGTITSGESSDAVSFTIAATDLIGDVTLYAPNNFEISLDGVNFSSEITLSIGEFEAGNIEIFVRFTPDSGVSGSISGEISITSPGMESKSISVSGTEDNPAAVIAYTSFEEGSLGKIYIDQGDQATDHDLTNYADSVMMIEYDGSGNEMAFDAFYYNTQDGVGLTDGDYVGFTDFTGAVGSYAEGNQGYQLSDTDGKVKLTFETVDISSYSNVDITMSVFFNSDSYEATDYLKVYVITNDGNIELINTEGQDIDDLGLEGMWTLLNGNLSGKTTAQLIVEFESNSGNEAVYLDQIVISGSN
ncbi:DUF5689 domain-containing protein [Marinigracilibium pacificum]|uniref:DUF5689 domain-containing protein n=1 Tax=Marinigracilibium pacificum TaxID=2729599 RepID=A0A848J4E0_9BACT|nr:DUF5689 domain-containing protein [Marinigracilibium pacificum]NMM50586.1 hypothetical protein [Marinigracilibium pacificum]